MPSANTASSGAIATAGAKPTKTNDPTAIIKIAAGRNTTLAAARVGVEWKTAVCTFNQK